jgi:hypothetical protein
MAADGHNAAADARANAVHIVRDARMVSSFAIRHRAESLRNVND